MPPTRLAECPQLVFLVSTGDTHSHMPRFSKFILYMEKICTWVEKIKGNIGEGKPE